LGCSASLFERQKCEMSDLAFPLSLLFCIKTLKVTDHGAFFPT
jgi:hypothetical protein